MPPKAGTIHDISKKAEVLMKISLTKEMKFSLKNIINKNEGGRGLLVYRVGHGSGGQFSTHFGPVPHPYGWGKIAL
jgi:hypothetical protein